MRKRRKKQIGVKYDDEGYVLNCYGKRIKWTKKELNKFKKEIKKTQSIVWE